MGRYVLDSEVGEMTCESDDQAALEARPPELLVGTIVRHRLEPRLLGRIVEIDHPWAKIELLTFPPDDWWSKFVKRPAPVRIECLEQVEQEAVTNKQVGYNLT